MKIAFVCKQCGSEFIRPKCHKPIFCNRKCYTESKQVSGAWNKGLRGIYSESTLDKMRLAKANFKPWCTGMKLPEVSERMKERHRTLIDIRGAKNPNWRGGKTLEARLLRKSNNYKLWRKEVLRRDNYHCVECRSTSDLQVHHIKPFSEYPKLRLDVTNGRTLCHSCHKKTPSYGRIPSCV